MKCPLAEKGCGGCRELTRMYGDVLHEKDAPFRALFPDALPILGMAEPRAYRNKVLRTFANGKSGLYHGIYRAGTHQVISVRRCLMENERANEIANIALSLLAVTGLSAYREDFHRGILRHMQVRRAHSTGQALVTIVTGTADFPGGEAFARRLMARCPDVRGVTQSINDRDTSAVMGFRSRVLAGRDEIWDELGGLKVCLTARSFYQINTVQAEKLYQRAIDLAQLTPGDRVLDAYCGVGLIGMLAARRAGQVRGVELVRDAVACARTAARVNRISNIDFICADAVNALRDDDFVPTVVFVDPPRAGCDARFLRSLSQAAPERIVYVSCCPETLRRDVDILRKAGYALQSAQPVDLFPYTAHTETVCLLSKLKSTQHIEVELDMDELDLTAAEKKATYDEIKDYVLEHSGLKVSSLYIAQVKQQCGIIERENYNKPKSEDAKQPQCPPDKEKAIKEALQHFGMI